MCDGRAIAVRLPASVDSEVSHDSSTVVIEANGRTSEAAARFVLDCSGRRGVVARGSLRRMEVSHRTLALTGIWRTTEGWAVPDDSHTLVATYADGWAWSIPTAFGTRYFTVMVDPGRTRLVRGQPSVAVYLAELKKVRPFQPLLDRGQLVAGPWGHDASLYSASQYAGPRYLLVGDAASFIDPLSSFGVKKALASAWIAAVATHTALVRPEMTRDALAFHDRREREVYMAYRLESARFACQAARDSNHPFWEARALVPEHLEKSASEDVGHGHDSRTAAAFDDLRLRPTVHLRRSRRLRTAPRAAIRGHEIALEDHLLPPDRPEAIRYLGGIDLLGLVALAPDHVSVGEMYEAYIDQHRPAPLPDFLRALSFLISTGALEHG
jgi:2-polyprenyl-6-methoxyphenol hydroxylase-like FAD-dependent oxidoreductase